jgi:glycine/D-amino acid oxidase-like deaminating enzyme
LMKVAEDLNSFRNLAAPPLLGIKTKIIRIIKTESEMANWRMTASQHPGLLQFVESSRRSDSIASVWFQGGGIVDCSRYVSDLWGTVVAGSGGAASWRKEAVRSDEDVNRLAMQFDAVILSCGASLPYLHDRLLHGNRLDVNLVRGQNIFLRTEQSAETNDVPSKVPEDELNAVLCGEYLIPRYAEDGSRYLFGGATHEYLKEYSLGPSDEPDLPEARKRLIGRLQQLLPDHLAPLVSADAAYAANAGVRVVTPRSHLGRVSQSPLPSPLSPHVLSAS